MVDLYLNAVSSMDVNPEIRRVLVGKPKGKKPIWRTRCRWVDNIKMDLRELGCDV